MSTTAMLFILVCFFYLFSLTPRSFYPLLHVHLLCADRVWGICGLHHPLQPETDASYHQSHSKCSCQARHRAAGRSQARRQQLGGEEGAHSDAADGYECELGFSGECLLKTEIRGEGHAGGWIRGVARRGGVPEERSGGRQRCF